MKIKTKREKHMAYGRVAFVRLYLKTQMIHLSSFICSSEQ